MKAEVELITPRAGRSWLFHTREETTFQFWWHAHEHYELTFIERGHGRRFAGNNASTYCPGDIALFGPSLPHAYVSDDRDHTQIAHIAQFRADVFGDALLENPEFRGLRSILTAAHRGILLTADPERLSSSITNLARLNGAEQTVALLELLVWLATSAHSTPLSTRPGSRTASHRSTHALIAAVQLLERNYKTSITRDQLAEMVAMTPSSLSRLFRRELGTTLTDYLSALRLGAAAELLADTQQPVADIAFCSGFANLANFNRQFRARYAMTPTRYRGAFTTARP